MNIPIAKPYFDNDEINSVSKVIKSGWITTGPKINEFEKIISKFTNAKYAVALSSGTTALDILLKCAGVKENDEIIVPSFSFIASANSILYQKAKPIFADIELSTLNSSAENIEKVITKKTKFILLVHQFGLCCNMKPITELAKHYGITIIEDSACALNSWYNNKHSGLFGKGGIFSFHPRKIITTGEGGMLITNNIDVYKKAMLIRNHGISINSNNKNSSNELIFEEYNELGYNYRLTDIQCAIGIEQMKKINYFISERRKIAEIYNSAFNKIENIQTPNDTKYTKHCYQSYALILKNKLKNKRNELILFLKEKGIATKRSATAINIQNLYKHMDQKCSNAEYADKNSISLPLWPGLKNNEIEYIIENIFNFIKNAN